MTWVRCRAGASFSGTFGNLCLVHPLQCFFFPPRGKGGGRGGFDGPLLPPPVGVRWQKPIKIGPCDASSLLEAPTMKVALTEVTGGHLVRSSTSFPCFPEKEKAGLEQHCLLSSPACHLAHFIQGADEGGGWMDTQATPKGLCLRQSPWVPLWVHQPWSGALCSYAL